MVGRYCAKNFTDMKSFNINYIFGFFSVTLKIPVAGWQNVQDCQFLSRRNHV